MKTVRFFSNVIGYLQDVNLRPTLQRISLAKMLFDGENRHATADMPHQEVLSLNACVSLATVYNTLDQFTDVGLFRKSELILSAITLIKNTTGHQHFFFEKTNQLKDVKLEDLALNFYTKNARWDSCQAH